MSAVSLLKKILPFAFGIALLFIIVQRAGIGEVAASVSSADKSLLAACLVIFFFNIMLRAFRWSLTLSKLVRLRLRDACMTYFAGQTVNEVLPVGSGELTRAQFIKRLSGTSRSKVLAPLMVERTLDVFVLLAFSAFGVGLLGGDHPFILSAIALIIAFLLLVLFKPSVAPQSVKLFSFAAIGPLKTPYARLAGVIASFAESLRTYSSDRRLLVSLLAVTALIWLFEVGSFLLVVRAIGLPLSYSQLLPIAAVAWLVGAFSFLPGGIGARDAAFSLLVASAGYPLTLGISASFVYRGVVYLVLGAAGVYSFVTLAARPQKN